MLAPQVCRELAPVLGGVAERQKEGGLEPADRMVA